MLIALISLLLSSAAVSGAPAAGVRTPAEFLEALAPLQGPGGPQTTVLLLENITLPGFAATLATLPARVPPNATLTLRGGEAVAPAPQAIVGSERPLGFWRTALPGAQPVVHACRLSSHLQAQLG